MPSDRSLYRKVQEVLEIARSVEVSSLPELRQAIKAKRSHVFNTSQYDADRDAITSRVSLRVIHESVRMCHFLQLIGEDGTLSDAGRDALRKGRFESVVAQSTLEILKRSGVRVASLNQSIVTSLQSKPPVLPTASHLWKSSADGVTIRYGTFAKLLTLLSHCGAAEVSQKKVYLRIVAS